MVWQYRRAEKPQSEANEMTTATETGYIAALNLRAIGGKPFRVFVNRNWLTQSAAFFDDRERAKVYPSEAVAYNSAQRGLVDYARSRGIDEAGIQVSVHRAA